MAATGSYDDASTADLTTQVSWTVSDTSITTIGLNTGLLTTQNAGSIWGATVGVTATLAPGTPGTSSLLVIASDSGSVAPRMPQQNDHWAALGLSPWGSWWGFQEASGSDTITGSGSAAFNLTRTDGTAGDGTGVHQGVGVVGWTRVGIVISGTTGGRVSAAAAVGPNANATSVAFLGYGKLEEDNTNATVQLMGLIGTSVSNRSAVSGLVAQPGVVTIQTAGGSKRTTGPNGSTHNKRLHPFLYVYNRTRGEAWTITDRVVAMTGGHAAVNDDVKGYGAVSNAAALSQSWVWGAACTGALAESLSDFSASADFLTRLGWRVPWKTCPTDSGTIKLPFLPMHYTELGLQPWTATWNMSNEGTTTAQDSFDKYDGVLTEGWQLTAGATSGDGPAAGWTRGAKIINQSASARFVRTNQGNNTMWNTTGSWAALGFISASIGSAANRHIMGQGAAAGGAVTCCVNLGVVGTGLLTAYCAGATATGTITITDGRYHPIMLVYDATNSRVKLYTDLEKLTGSFVALQQVNSVTGAINFGGGQLTAFNTPPPMGIVYGAFCTGTLAESMSGDGVASAYLKSLGWTVGW